MKNLVVFLRRRLQLLEAAAVAAGDAFFNYVTLLLPGSGAGSSTFKDASTNNFPLVLNGDVGNSNFSPYNTSWSNYFDGNGDGIYTASNSAFDFGTGDFTLEAWVNKQANGASSDAVGNVVAYVGNGSSNSAWISVDNSGNVRGKIAYNSGTGVWALEISGTTALGNGSWNHVAITRSGSTVRLFVNGAQEASGSNSTDLSTYGTNSSVGYQYNGSRNFNGYVSSARIVKGTAVYTSNFTPSTTPLTAISGTSLLTCQSNRFIDNSTNGFAITVNGNTSIKAFSPFADTDTTTGAAYFDGSGDYLTVANSANYALGTSDFTIELWWYPTASFSSALTLFSHGYVSFCPWVFYTGSSNTLVAYASSSGSSWDVLNGANFGTVTINAWNHIALCRSGSTFYLCLNGVVTSTATSSASLMSIASGLTIGATTSGIGVISSSYISGARIIKGTALYTAAFTPPTAPLTAITNTQLLTLQNRGPSRNSTFLDSSANKFLITRNGNTTQGTFSPFSQTGWGAYFDGTGDYLSGIGTVSDFNFMHQSSALFTFECWVYINSLAADRYLIDNTNGTSNQIGINIYVGTDGKVYVSITRGVTSSFVLAGASSTGTVSTNSWNHIAVTYDQSLGSDNCKFYINGVASGTGTKTANAPSASNASNAMRVGAFASGSGPFFGYISNLRITNSIVYSSAFTPSTTPLTAIANTELLTCQSNRFIDNSSNAFAITANGNTSIQAFSPFNPTAAWSAATNGGSGYFDGSGDYLNFTDSSNALDLGGIVASIEAWFYPISTGTAVVINKHGGSSNWNTTSGFEWQVQWVSAVFNVYYNNGGSPALLTDGITRQANQWYHVAVATDASNNISIFINGTRTATTSNAITKPTNRTNILLGVDLNSNYYSGYLSGIRFATGVDAYSASSSTITIPTAPITATTNTQLLCNFDNIGIYDATAKNDLETVGNAQISTTQSKFGGSSMYFDGSGDYSKGNQATNNLYQFESDFTIEMWIRSGSYAAVGLGYPTTFATSTFTGTGIGIKLQDSGGIGTAGCACVWYNNSQILTGTNNVADNNWHHIAVSRNGSTIKLFVDGAEQDSATNSASFTVSSGYPLIGADSTTAGNFTGYINDLRVTKGVARYTTGFTPPTAAFPLT